MRCYLLLAALLSTKAPTAQIARLTVAAVYPQLTVYSTQQTDVFSFRSNAASLAGITTFSAGISSERRFLLKELSAHSIVAALPVAAGAFGVKADYYGSAAYNETLLGFNYGRKLGEAASIGVGFQYTRLAATGYGAASVAGFDVGVVFRVLEGLRTGIAAHNPVGMRFGKSGEEKLPAVYSAGIGWDVSPELFIGGEVQKIADAGLSLNGGMQYVFAERLVARAGIASGTSLYFLGFGVKFGGLRIDLMASFHPSVGATPGLLMLYSAKP